MGINRRNTDTSGKSSLSGGNKNVAQNIFSRVGSVANYFTNMKNNLDPHRPKLVDIDDIIPSRNPLLTVLKKPAERILGLSRINRGYADAQLLVTVQKEDDHRLLFYRDGGVIRCRCIHCKTSGKYR